MIKDLLPLYIDECCSQDSAELVAGHLEHCPDCQRTFQSMRQVCSAQAVERQEIPLSSISNWKASVLQSVMLFVSFAMMTLGVILEGSTPAGDGNGLWAVALIVPATGYLLSLANWFFIRAYGSRKAFSKGSSLVTLAMTAVGYVWAAIHYAGDFALTAPLVWFGVVLSAVSCLLSGFLSSRYALLLGRG